MPFGKTVSLDRTIIGAVDLDRRHLAGGIFKLALLRQLVGIEVVAPWLESPAANADPDGANVLAHAALHLPLLMFNRGCVFAEVYSHNPPEIFPSPDGSAFKASERSECSAIGLLRYCFW